jgi:hypothetical protein
MKTICRKTIEIHGEHIISLNFKYANRINSLKIALERANKPIQGYKLFIVSATGEFNSDTRVFTLVEELSRTEIDLEFLAKICKCEEVDLLF